MHHLTAACLRAEVVIRPFDAVAGDCRFVVAVDDRHFVVTAAVAAVLEESRHPATLVSVAKRASARLGLAISAAQVEELLREKAPPVLFHAADAHLQRRGPMRLRRALASAAALDPVLAWVARLFAARTAILLGCVFAAVESLVVARALAVAPHSMSVAQMAEAIALTVLGIAIHELGHLAACVRYGAPHGGVGVGLYWCFPAFYAEVHGAWLLPRRQRAVVDAGGLYLQCCYVLLLGALYLACGLPCLLSAIACSHLLMLHTLNPVLKYDGYWLLTDLTGAHNLHGRIRVIAQELWRVLFGAPLGRMPARSELVLLAAFSAAALAYFTYVLLMLGRSLAVMASDAVLAWAAHEESALDTVQAIGRTVLLAVLVAVAFGVSRLLARSLCAVAQGGTHDR